MMMIIKFSFLQHLPTIIIMKNIFAYTETHLFSFSYFRFIVDILLSSLSMVHCHSAGRPAPFGPSFFFISFVLSVIKLKFFHLFLFSENTQRETWTSKIKQNKANLILYWKKNKQKFYRNWKNKTFFILEKFCFKRG